MKRFGALALLFTLGSCGSPAVDDGSLRIESLEYTLAPGEERYYCYAMTVPGDAETVITEYHPEYGEGTHHIFLAQTLAPEPDGFSECNVLVRTTWLPLFAGGVSTSPLILPAGTGVRLPPGTQVLLQLHLQNTTSAPITSRTAVRMVLGDPTAEIMQAGVFGLDNRTVTLPARANDVMSEMSCVPGHDMDVFAVLGHMHQLGTRLEVFRGPPGSTDLLFEQTWDFADQPTTTASFHVSATDELTLRCYHDNPGDTDVVYGESSDDEMCVFVMYYTPYGGLDGCIEAP